MSIADLDELIVAAEAVLGRTPAGTGALAELGWVPTGDPADDAWRSQYAALFQAQGRVLAATPALGIAVAQVITGGDVDLSVVAAGRARRLGDRIHLTGTLLQTSKLVVTLDGRTFEVDPADLHDVEPGEALDPTAVSAGWVAENRLVEIGGGSARWPQAQAVARLAIAFETLGACEHLLVTAVQYTRDRHQFGKPIGSFQAVQHILAGAHVQLCGLRDGALTVLDVLMDGAVLPFEEILLLKALAGRTGRVVGQATLQVLGAVGFTFEHEHHRYLRRTLTLDSFYGTVEEVTLELGTTALRDGIVPAAVL